jgi:hypothetical protein
METFLAICLGIGLSAACGLRVFVPPLIVGIAAANGYLDLAPSFDWMASPAALTAFGVAALVEIVAYLIPWLDHLLDSVTTPAAVVAGVLMTAVVLVDLDPWVTWSLALIAGGGAAAATQGATGLLRLGSTMSTGGLANPILGALETTGSVVTSILALIAPILIAGFVVLFVSLALMWRRRVTVGHPPQ